MRLPRRPPELHGPYPTWTRKISGRTISRTLTPEDADVAAPYFDATATCASSSPNSKPSPSSSPGNPGHHTPSREISPPNAGPAHRKPAKTTGQRVLSVAHQFPQVKALSQPGEGLCVPGAVVKRVAATRLRAAQRRDGGDRMARDETAWTW